MSLACEYLEVHVHKLLRRARLDSTGTFGFPGGPLACYIWLAMLTSLCPGNNFCCLDLQRSNFALAIWVGLPVVYWANTSREIVLIKWTHVMRWDCLTSGLAMQCTDPIVASLLHALVHTNLLHVRSVPTGTCAFPLGQWQDTLDLGCLDDLVVFWLLLLLSEVVLRLH